MSNLKRKSQIYLSNEKSFPKEPSEVRKILIEMSEQKQSQRKNTLYQDRLIFLRMAKYDSSVKERHKFQLRNQLSPLEWKSSYANSEFSKNQRVNATIMTGWDRQRVNMAQRSYNQPKDFYGIKCDLYSRQFSQDISKTYSNGFKKKLKQVEVEYEKKVFQGKIQNIRQRRQQNIQAIKSRGTRLQLSKDKLFGFTTPIKKSLQKRTPRQRNTISHFYDANIKKYD